MKSINAKQLPDQITGNQYLKEIDKNIEQLADENNLVIVYGQSDDLLEFRGAIYGELSAWTGCKACIFNNRFINKYDHWLQDKDLLEQYGFTAKPDHIIDAVWEPAGLDASWLINVDGGHAFDILEDGKLYCRGVVFELNQKNN